MNIKDEIAALNLFQRRLDEQDALVIALGTGLTATVSNQTNRLIRAVFREILAYKASFVSPYESSIDPADVRPQIRDARTKIEGRIKELENTIMPEVITSPSPTARKIFVVHGRNLKARDAIFAFLRHVDLDPMEWESAVSLTGSAAPTVLDTLQAGFAHAQAAVIILTGDDMARLGKHYQKPHDEQHEKQLTPQARQNVLFEAGMAFGMYPRRTILVSFGRTRPISDISGVHILHLSDSPESRQDLAGRLETAQCAVATSHKRDWMRAGDFSSPILEDPDLVGDSSSYGLRVSRKEANAETEAHYKPKIWVEIRNQGKECVELRHLEWASPTTSSVVINFTPNTLQLRIGGEWCPPEKGVDRLQLPAGETCRTWIQPTETFKLEDLENRCRQEGQIGTLSLTVDDKTISLVV